MSFTVSLPPTVNMHIVGHCNYGCRYCYARFEKAKTYLPIEAALTILRQLPSRGVRRVTFAGGEPTLHPQLLEMLRACADLGLITSVVTNGSQLDRDACRRLFPWVRWLVLSCDSHVAATNVAMGRAPKKKLDTIGQVIRAENVARSVHEWNASCSRAEHVRLKVNIVVTSLNMHEDPGPWLAELKPERVKLLQCCIIPGENDDAEHLKCGASDFATYAARAQRIESEMLKIVAETSTDLLDSYAMVDPLGRFRQAHATGYVESKPIHEIGVDAAWAQIGGCDMDRFHARGGVYEDGMPSIGVTHPIIAIEGLDGSGKSTVVHELAARLGAEVVSNPPTRLQAGRARADVLPDDQRRAWYWNANREAMNDATEFVFAGRTVVMDRCFASTAAYGAAEKGVVAAVSEVPRDVPKPDHVFFLALHEDERRRRLAGRGDARTAEEGRLSTDAAFRQRVIDGYVALGAQRVDAMMSVSDAVDAIMRPTTFAGRVALRPQATKE